MNQRFVGFIVGMQTAFIIFKIAGGTTMHWIWVFEPTWITLVWLILALLFTKKQTTNGLEHQHD